MVLDSPDRSAEISAEIFAISQEDFFTSPGQLIGTCAQPTSLQISTVQETPSLQYVLFGVYVHPAALSEQTSTVHATESSQ